MGMTDGTRHASPPDKEDGKMAVSSNCEKPALVRAASAKFYVLGGVAITALAGVFLFSHPRVISSLEAAQDGQLSNGEPERPRTHKPLGLTRPHPPSSP